ncbi:MAG TPA: hypothetical protein VL463_17205 [Kofleriaceae bacterium]|nr:hypothetical protein [Kofleriaceae bacterium]
MCKVALVAAVLFTAATAAADPWSSRVTGAADSCRSDASQLRALAADCRARSEPPPEGGEYCTGIHYSETTPDGQVLEYDLSPDQAEQIADQFDAYAPTLDAAASRISELEDAAATTEDKIRELGFDKAREDYEGWLALAESSREELAKESKKFLIGRAFDSAGALADGIASLSRGRAQKMADRLARYGDAGVELGKELKRIARIAGRREKAEAAAAAVEGLKALYEQASADDDLDALASALGEAVELEGFGFLVDEIKWTTAAAYAYAAGTIASDRMDQLAAMQAMQLRALKSLTSLLERQVARIDAELEPIHGCSYARPSV